MRRIRGASGLIEAIAVGVAAILLLAWRAPFAAQQLWAEDGTVFLQQVINQGVWEPFGYAYAGHYLFLPRIVGALAAGAPSREAAFAMWAGTALIVGWCAATIYAPVDPEAKLWVVRLPCRELR